MIILIKKARNITFVMYQTLEIMFLHTSKHQEESRKYTRTGVWDSQGKEGEGRE